MGNSLDATTLRGFIAEIEFLEKQAGIPNLVMRLGTRVGRFGGRTFKGQTQGWRAAGEAALHPIKSLKEGWRAMAPMHEVGVKGGPHLTQPGQRLRDILRGTTGQGRVKGTMEELSRR